MNFCSRRESNPHHNLRKVASYPLNDESRPKKCNILLWFFHIFRVTRIAPRAHRAHDCAMHIPKGSIGSRGVSILAGLVAVAVLGVVLMFIQFAAPLNNPRALTAGGAPLNSSSAASQSSADAACNTLEGLVPERTTGQWVLASNNTAQPSAVKIAPPTDPQTVDDKCVSVVATPTLAGALTILTCHGADVTLSDASSTGKLTATYTPDANQPEGECKCTFNDNGVTRACSTTDLNNTLGAPSGQTPSSTTPPPTTPPPTAGNPAGYQGPCPNGQPVDPITGACSSSATPAYQGPSGQTPPPTAGNPAGYQGPCPNGQPVDPTTGQCTVGSNITGFSNSGLTNGLSSLLTGLATGLARGLMPALTAPVAVPAQACSTDPTAYAQQQQQYQMALQTYNTQLQQYQYQMQLNQYNSSYYGSYAAAPAPPAPPAACTPSTQSQCSLYMYNANT